MEHKFKHPFLSESLFNFFEITLILDYYFINPEPEPKKLQKKSELLVLCIYKFVNFFIFFVKKLTRTKIQNVPEYMQLRII